MSRSARKQTLWTLRKVSTQISLSMPRRQTRTGQTPVDFLFQESLLYTYIPLRRNVSARISLRGMRMLVRVDTLRRVHHFFFVERLIYLYYSLISQKVFEKHLIYFMESGHIL